jgi:hypothetical protein
MTVIVSAGFCWIDQHDTGGQGTYLCVNDGDVTLTVQPAGGAGQYRKDTVVASVYDAEYAGSANEWRLEIIQGPYASSAGAAVRGTLPNNAQILADISIGPNQTSVSASNIGDVRNYTVAAGGILPVSSNVAPNRPHPGQVMYLTDTDTFRYGKSDGTTGELQRAIPGAWSSWTPAWTTSSGNATPSFGNATLICNAVKIGRTVIGNFEIQFGSTTNFGSNPTASDNWQFSLPYTGARSEQCIGFAEINRTTGARAVVRLRMLTNNTFSLEVSSGRPDAVAVSSGGLVDSISPWVWESGNSIRGSLQYEAAS